MINEKLLVMMIGQSFFKMPYHTQPPNPDNRINSIKKEIASAFFSLSILKSCGNNEHAVKIPAPIPT